MHLYDSWNAVRKNELLETEMDHVGYYSKLNINTTKKNLKEFENEFNKLAHKLKATIAFDAVGGEHSGQLLNNMPSNSKVLLYGGLSGQNASNFDILGTIFHKKSFEGFNLGDWMRETKPEHFNEVSNFLQDLIINKEVETKIQRVIKLEDAFDGLYQYVTKMSDGKVIFNPTII